MGFKEPPDASPGFAPQPEAPGDRALRGGLIYGAPFPEGYEMCPHCHAGMVNMNRPIRHATGIIYRCERCGKFCQEER
jgi:hypothetical protein